MFRVHQSSLIFKSSEKYQISTCLRIFNWCFAIVPTGQVIVTAFNENTADEIMIAEGSLSPSDKVVTRGLRDQKPATKASKSDDSFNPYEEDDSVNRETEEIFNPYLEDGAGSSSVDQLLLALAKSGKTITINASDLNIDEDFKSKEKLSYYLYKKDFRFSQILVAKTQE